MSATLVTMRTLEATMANPRFVSVNLTPAARDALRLLTARLTVDLNRRVSMGDAVMTLHAVAQQHPEEITEAARRLLTPEGDTPS